MDLTQEQWSNQQSADKKSIILDVRTSEEFEAGYIPEAKQLDIRNPETFVQGLESLDKSASYYVYCRSGARSAQACQVMSQMGFETTFNLLGGILDWKGEVA
jgi:rhodanese-related sulfurtransferase